MDKRITDELARLNVLIWTLKAEVLALRLSAAAQCHPNKADLAAAFHAHAEQAIADTLTRDFPEGIRERFEQEIESVRQYLNGIAQAQRENKGD